MRILDNGELEVLNISGTEQDVIDSARISYGRGTKKSSSNINLLNYLIEHRHWSCFEMVTLKFYVKAPIFVARQWMRHRASYNEYSARYSEMEDSFYIPELSVITEQCSINRQARTEKSLDNLNAECFRSNLKKLCSDSYNLYKKALESGIPRELARTMLPVNIYTKFYYQTNLRDLLHFIELRSEKNAQYEIREYAKALSEIVHIAFPNIHTAFKRFYLESQTLSKDQIDYLKGEDITLKPRQERDIEWLTR